MICRLQAGEKLSAALDCLEAHALPLCQMAADARAIFFVCGDHRSDIIALAALCEAEESHRAPAVFAAWNKDDTVRRDSTSGGVFSLIADFIIESGGVVFGAAMDSRMHVKHVACWDKKELWRHRGFERN